MRTVQLALLVTTLGLSALAPAPAAADAPAVSCTFDCNAEVTGTADSGDGTIDVTVLDSTPGGGGGHPISSPPAWLAACTWELAPEGSAIPAELLGGDVGGTGVWDADTWIVRCPSSSALALGLPIVGAGGIVEVFADGNVPPRIIDALIREAADQTPLTAFYPSSAPEGTIDSPLITQVSTFLWVDDDQWQPVSATASIPPLSVTATATPVSTLWSGGDDPAEVLCAQGFPARTEQDFADNDGACQMTYKHSSAVADHQLTVTVTWDVTYVCSAICGSGTLASQVITSTRAVRVAEFQAVATG